MRLVFKILAVFGVFTVINIPLFYGQLIDREGSPWVFFISMAALYWTAAFGLAYLFAEPQPKDSALKEGALLLAIVTIPMALGGPITAIVIAVGGASAAALIKVMAICLVQPAITTLGAFMGVRLRRRSRGLS